MKSRVKILGCRGSVPVSGDAFSHYGGATSSIFLQMEGQTVVLDAGTGLLSLPAVLDQGIREIPVLLSHAHVDHLLGLPICLPALQPGYHFHIYARPRQGLGPEEQIRALMSPPLWPVGPEMLPAAFSFHPVSEDGFVLGNIQVDCLEGVHPDGVTLFRLTAGNKTVVYIPDCTLNDAMMEQAAAFARDCTLLLCDGQYAPEEWPACRDFGHSTWEMAARLGSLSGAGMTRIIHHDPCHTDACLAEASARVEQLCPHCTFAYEGEDIPL